MGLRELAAAWVRANCPNPAVHKDFLHHLDRAVAHGVGCTFLVGRELTKRAKPMLVACHCGELFAFDLTIPQAEQVRVKNDMLVCSLGATQQNHSPKPEPLICLEAVEVDRAERLDPNEPITGTLQYRTIRPLLGPLAIHVTCEPPGRASITLYAYPPALHLPVGAVRIAFSKLGDMCDREGVRFAGAVPLFFRIFTAEEPVMPIVPARVAPTAPRHASPVPASGIPSIKPVSPASSAFPPPYDPRPPFAPASAEVRPISDIRAVLVEVV